MSSMNTYDMYMQSYQKAMAPAIDYLQRSEAAKTMGLEYSKLTPEQINQYFGSTPQYATSSQTSALQNMAIQANGGKNPYLQGLQSSQPYSQTGQMSYAQSYPQLPAYNQSYTQPYSANVMPSQMMPTSMSAYPTQPTYNQSYAQPYSSSVIPSQMMPMAMSPYPYTSAAAPQYPQSMIRPSVGYMPSLTPFQGYQPQMTAMPLGFVPYTNAAMPLPINMMYPPVLRAPVPYPQAQYRPVYAFIPPTQMFA